MTIIQCIIDQAYFEEAISISHQKCMHIIKINNIALLQQGKRCKLTNCKLYEMNLKQIFCSLYLRWIMCEIKQWIIIHNPSIACHYFFCCFIIVCKFFFIHPWGQWWEWLHKVSEKGNIPAVQEYSWNSLIWYQLTLQMFFLY